MATAKTHLDNIFQNRRVGRRSTFTATSRGAGPSIDPQGQAANTRSVLHSGPGAFDAGGPRRNSQRIAT
jgi:hypothetical protein